MYETHFGFSGPPFQLNPDPAFLFESANHGRALSYLRFGIQQGEGFIVITGDIGAGKTTLVRALLQQLDPAQVVAAHLANTQLESAELLHCILTAFGVPAQGLGKGGMIANLEAFLTSVAASGRRALLIVDEAQNLSVQAMEELRMLSNFQLGRHALLQSFLIGQPELRGLLQGPAMEQLRQRILASYHLGPLSVGETAAYVRHRLQHVGWRGDPPFDEFAFATLHERTGGVPRRINQLCNRVLLSAYLSSATGISKELVQQTADELHGELSLSGLQAPAASAPNLAAQDVDTRIVDLVDPVPHEARTAAIAPAPMAAPVVLAPVNLPVASRPAQIHLPQESELRSLPAMPSAQDLDLGEPPAPHEPVQPSVASLPGAPSLPPLPTAPSSARMTAVARRGPVILGLSDAQMSHAKLHRVAMRWRQEGHVGKFVCAHIGSAEALNQAPIESRSRDLWGVPDTFVPDLSDGGAEGSWTSWLQQQQVEVLVVSGSSWPLLQTALAARKLGITVMRLGAGEQRGESDNELSMLSALLDRSSHWLCCAGLGEQQALAAEGIPAHRVARVGNLAAGVLQSLASQVPEFPKALAQCSLSTNWLSRAATGFGLITAQFSSDDVSPDDALQWLMLARLAHTELPMLWTADTQTLQVMRDPSLRAQIESSGIAVVGKPSLFNQLSLLTRARCVMASPARTLVEEAQALAVPVVMVQLCGNPAVPIEGSGLIQVGPSAVQLRTAVRAANQYHGSSGQLHDLDDDAAIEAAQQLARWMRRRDVGAAAFEEAVA